MVKVAQSVTILAEKMDLSPALVEEALGGAEPLKQVMGAVDLLTNIVRVSAVNPEMLPEARQLAEFAKSGAYRAIDQLDASLKTLSRLEALARSPSRRGPKPKARKPSLP